MALICHCLAIPESTIVAAIGTECTDICDLAARCGAGAECGGCHAAIDELLRQHLGSADAA